MTPWTFQQIEPCPARGKFSESMFDDPAYAAEPKRDGHRQIVQFCGAAPRFTSRRASSGGSGFVESTSREGMRLLAAPAPPRLVDLSGTVLDGEVLMAEGESDSNRVASAMAGPPGALRYEVFDCLFLQGLDLRQQPMHLRRESARIAVEVWGNPHVALIPQAVKAQAKRRMALDELESAEGVIFKKLDAPYVQSAWAKLKSEATYDVIVIGFEPGRAGFAGMVGAIEFGQYVGGELTAMGTASGFDMKLRAELSANPHSYLGRVFSITANKRFPTGRFRHPRFKCWRPEKSAQDCSYRGGET